MELLKKLNKILILSLLMVIVIISSFPVYAGSTGKITGKITDAITDETLIGVNIIIADLPGLGAATDFNGEYVILNVQPGTYTVRISMIGYKTVEIQDVRVFIDRIIKVDAELEEEAFEVSGFKSQLCQ